MLPPLKILMTASGAPGCSTLIRKLKETQERDIEIIGTDMAHDVIGSCFADRFHIVPAADNPDFIPALLDIAEREEPDLLFPVSSAEVYAVSVAREEFENRGIRVLVSDPEPLALASNKHELYRAMKGCDVSCPEFRAPSSLDAFVKAVTDLGYPDKAVCFKPYVSKGSRGFRILEPSVSRKSLLLDHKPNNVYMSLDEFVNIFEDEPEFPDLLVMEVVEGVEYDAMTLALNGDALLTTVKTRERSRWGVITLGALVDQPRIHELIRRILQRIPLSYNLSVQFIGEKLIEINPRTSTFIYQPDLNEPYMAIKLCLGEMTPNEVRRAEDRIRYGRRMMRYMDQVFWDPGCEWES